MHHQPLVSILIPAFNAQEWILETIVSALAQTWPRKEIIVVDDGSKDRTVELASRFEGKGVKVTRQDNLGAAAARNRALSLCQGEYIQWLDADDLLAHDKIAEQMKVIEQCGDPRILVSSAWARFMYRVRVAKFTPTDLWCDLPPNEWLVRKLGQNLFMQTAVWLVSRELTEAAGPWDTTLLGDDDGEYFCRVLLESRGVAFAPQARVYYRVASNSLSSIQRCDRKLEAQIQSMRLHIGYLRSLEDSPRVRTACLRYLQNWLFFWYPDRLDLVEEAEQMAHELGGKLEPPRFPPRYAWIESLFGAWCASRAQSSLSRLKWSMSRAWDKTLFKMESRLLRAGEFQPRA